MTFDGASRDAETVGYFLVALALCQQLNDFSLATGQNHPGGDLVAAWGRSLREIGFYYRLGNS